MSPSLTPETRIRPDQPKRSLLLYIPPPLLFVACFLAGSQLDWLVTSSSLPDSIASFALVTGVALIGTAALMIVPAPILFLLRRTTIIPHGTSRVLVTAGPYRFTRNPMYLALAIAYVGVALSLNVFWPLLLLPLPIWVMSTKVIPVEEGALDEAFGDEYRTYQRRVRRWL